MMTNTSINITLAWHEYAMASEIGRLRQLTSVRRGSQDNHGFTGLGWSEHIEGACGEMAVSKFLGVYWDGGIDTFKSADVGANIQVRTRSSHNYELIVRPDDYDDDIYVLVTGKCPNYRIRGYIYGNEAKMSEYLQNHGNRPSAYFVPHSKLLDINNLKGKR
jgi:hypothetical protein